MATPMTERRMTRATARALGVTPSVPEQQPPTTVTRARRGAATEPRAPRALDSLASPARAAPVKLFSEVLATPTRRVALGDRSNAQASTPAAKTPTAAQTSPAVTLAAACESAQFLPSTPSAAPSVVADILESPIVELSSPVAVLLAQALPPSPATVEVTLSPALSPLPAAAVHALPFVPRSLAARSAAKAVAAASPSNLSMNALRRQYKDALIVSAGRWRMDDEGVKSAHSAGSGTTTCVDEDSEVVESAPAAAPRVKVQLASVVVAKPSYSAIAKLKAAPVAPCESKDTHDLKGMPAGSGVHVHFDEGEGEVQSRGGIKGTLACGVHTRFE